MLLGLDASIASRAGPWLGTSMAKLSNQSILLVITAAMGPRPNGIFAHPCPSKAACAGQGEGCRVSPLQAEATHGCQTQASSTWQGLSQWNSGPAGGFSVGRMTEQ